MYSNLFIKGLDLRTPEQDINDYFSRFGEVTSCKFNKMTGIAFVSYSERLSAKQAKDSDFS